ncbi:hypothetical protein NKR23_g4288 [Pleurostoma richardsiae]|uniref:Uncharacterized protein n=1 Tax=Pleurostoma richardsiae TaxID=41990 RepID=A0AA38S2J2_9PEZI|nr:hypothetical protein NKR23_g4288 [Pleurostoma richardsiae]
MPLFINLRIFAGCDEHLTKKHGILEADKSMLDAMRRFSVLRAVSKEVNKLFARLPHTMQTYKGTIRFHASKDLFMLRYLDHLSYWSMSDKKLQALQSILPSGMVDVGIYLEFNAAWLPKRESDLTMLPLIAPALLSVKRIFLAMPHCLGKHKGDGYLLKAEEDVSSETGETTPQRHYVWQPGPADNAPDGMMYRIRALEKIMNEALQRLAGCKNAQHSSLEVQKWIQRLEFVGLMHHDYGGSRVGTRYVMD